MQRTRTVENERLRQDTYCFSFAFLVCNCLNCKYNTLDISFPAAHPIYDQHQYQQRQHHHTDLLNQRIVKSRF